MSLVLVNAALLPLAALVAVPLLVHLFARARPPVYRFGSVEFLRRLQRKTIRLERPQSLLVLLVRTLLCAALVGLVLKPVLFHGGRLGGAGTRRNVVLLVDATASMAAVEGTQTRFAAACARASEVPSGLGGDDLAAIVWLGSPNRSELPRLSPNVAFLKKALRTASVTAEAADLEGALALAADLLRDQPGAAEIYLLSDFQHSTWGAQPLLPPAGATVHPLKIGRAEIANLAIVSLSVEPANPLPGQEVTATCEVRSFSPAHTLVSLHLRAGDTPQVRELRLAPGATETALFRLAFDTPGEKTVAASLDEDAFPLDNDRWAVLDVVERVQVGLVDGNPQTAGYWRRALAALEWVKMETVEAAQLGLFDGDALYLAGAPASGAVAPLRNYLARGGLVVWAPAPGVEVAGLPMAAVPPGTAPLGEGEIFRLERLASPQRLGIADRANPAFKVFGDGLYGDPTDAVFRGRLAVPAGLRAGSGVILNYEDGVPALAFLDEARRLLFWNLPLERELSDWALQPEFLPFFGELLYHNRRAGAPQRARRFTTGQRLVREFDGVVLADDVRLEHGGQPLPTARRALGERTEFSTDTARQPGLYAWYHRGALLERQAVNFPVIESDLRTQSEVALGGRAVAAIGGGQSIRQLQEGSPLQPQLLLLAVVCLVAEGLILVKGGRA